MFGPVPGPTPGKRRLHIDVNPTDRDQDAELERLSVLGAVPADVGRTADEAGTCRPTPKAISSAC